MKNKPLYYISDINGEKFPYEEYLNIEKDGFHKHYDEIKSFKALPKELYPFTVEYAYNPFTGRKTLNNYEKTYNNFYFWIENVSLIKKLYIADRGEIISFIDKDGAKKHKIKEDNTVFSFDDILNNFFHVKNKESFIKLYNRHIRSHCDKYKISDDDFPISFEIMVEISNLDTKKYHIDDIVKSMIEKQINNLNDLELIKENFIIDNSTDIDLNIISEVVNENYNKFVAYKSGQEGLINLFFGNYLKKLSNKNVNKENLMISIKKHFEGIKIN
jgi:hypothetical protein